MNVFKRFFIRVFQKVLYVACFFLSFKEPKIIKGEDAFDKLAVLLKEKKKNNVLIVTDEGLHNLKMDQILIDCFNKYNIKNTLFYNVTANPTINQVENGLKVYKENNCDCIVTIGGGSAMDAAKIIGARVNNKKSISKMKGLLKITRKLPLLVAIPTTAGTGSETTLAAVISDPINKEKFPIEDSKIIPKYAILNPSLLVNLPSKITSTTGMDALTHAIEAYIGNSNTRKTKKNALEAIKLVFENLSLSYHNPTNLTYRENMQVAAFKAGVAFTRAYVGYVHAIAHALGAYYHIPHGLANAVVLPYVLEEFDSKAYNKLAKIYDEINPSSNLTKKEKSLLLIKQIKQLNKDIDILDSFKDVIKDEDINSIATHAYKEAIPLYPTPTLWDKQTFIKVINKIKK